MIAYKDILDRPFSEFTCSGACRFALSRWMGEEIPEDEFPDEVGSLDKVRSGHTGWERVGDNWRHAKLGDVVLSRNQDGGAHVTLVVEREYGLTSSEVRGVHGIKLRGVQNVEGVFRRTS